MKTHPGRDVGVGGDEQLEGTCSVFWKILENLEGKKCGSGLSRLSNKNLLTTDESQNHEKHIRTLHRFFDDDPSGEPGFGSVQHD